MEHVNFNFRSGVYTTVHDESSSCVGCAFENDSDSCYSTTLQKVSGVKSCYDSKILFKTVRSKIMQQGDLLATWVKYSRQVRELNSYIRSSETSPSEKDEARAKLIEIDPLEIKAYEAWRDFK